MKRPPAKRITFAFSLALLCAFPLGGCGRDADAPAAPPAADPPASPTEPAAPVEPSTPPPVATEPGVADAVTVLERYYRAIDQGDYAEAYALWSDGGRASGQEFAAFAAGFDDTASVAVDVGAPGRVEGAAGSRYVSIPVVVRATHDDGSEHRYAGDYTLRRAVVDGATAEQRAWRIASAELRETAAQSSKR